MLERIGLIVSELGITITEFEREIGVSESSIKNGLKGNSGPRTELYLKIYRRYPTLNLHWLITGEGEMFLKKEQSKNQNTIEEPQNEYQKRLVEVQSEQIDFLKQQVEHWRAQAAKWQEEYDKCKDKEPQSKAG